MAEREDPETTRAAHWGGIAAGMMAAVIAGWWSRPQISAGFSPAAALLRALLWLLATVIAGTVGMALAGGFTWAREQRRPLRVAMNAAAVWVLIPPLILLLLEASPRLLALVVALAAGLAICLWALAPREPHDEASGWETIGTGPQFAELPPSKSGAKQSALIAMCLELALVLWMRGDPFWAAMWLALGFGLLAWKALASAARPGSKAADPEARLSGAGLAAMAVVLLLLAVHPLHAGPAGPARERAPEQKQGTAVDDAYRGIVLFTVAEKKKEIPPPPVERSLLRTGASRPVVIPFDGAYWYFQAPQHGPGLHPHLAYGDPVAMNIYSTGWVPLAMQAHQTLAHPIPVRGGEQFEVTLRNGDNHEGRIEVGVLLTDSRGPGVVPLEKPTLMLGVKPMLSSEPPAFRYKANPVEEDLTFTVPAHPAAREFDTITVLFFPSAVRDTRGARVGIEQFELLPRGSR